jgi:hypothetical protein
VKDRLVFLRLNPFLRLDRRLGCALLLLAAAGGCGAPKLESDWLGQPIRIDGDPADWKDTLYSLEDGRFMVGARNDDANLYLCLGTSDRMLRREILRGGFTIWFDPAGGKAKTFGIRFAGSRRSIPTEPGSLGLGAPGDSSLSLAILEPGGTWTRLLAADTSEIAFRMADTDETVACEIRIPLARNGGRAHGIGTAPGRTIGLGVETPELEPRQNREGPGEESGSGWRRGGRGGRGGGRPGRGHPELAYGDPDEGDPNGGDSGGWDPSDDDPGGRGPGGGWPGGGGHRWGEHRPGSSGPIHLWTRLRLAEERK